MNFKKESFYENDNSLFVDDHKETYKEALINGKIINYDWAQNKEEGEKYGVPNEKKWEYLGEGIIYAIDGIEQSFKNIEQFYRIRNKII